MKTIVSKGVKLRYGNTGYLADNVDDALKIFKEKGVVVLTGVLNEEECQEMRNGAWETANFLTQNLPTPATPENSASLQFLQPLNGGLYQHHRWGHAPYVWKIRQNPKVMEFHRRFYDVEKEDLLVSFDGIHFSPGQKPFNGHYNIHLDQGFEKDKAGKFMCIQGWVTSEDIKPGDGTFRFLSRSHLFHKDFCDTIKLHDYKGDWIPLGGKEITLEYFYYMTRGCQDTCITCPAGSMVFWDSRTVHSGIERLEEVEPSLRNIVYVCYMPREKCQGTLKKRAQIFDPDHKYYMRNSSHWTDQMKLFSPYPYERRKELTDEEKEKKWSIIPKLESPIDIMTPLGKRIAGLI